MRRSNALAAVGVLGAGLLIGVSLANFAVRGRAPLLVGSAGAATTGETYVLSGFKVEYPYVPLDPTADSDPTRAGLSFTAVWSGASFPGEALCTVTLINGAGDTVGSVEFPASFASEPAMPVFPVEVSDRPASAEGTCDDGTYEPGPGYIFESPTIEASDKGGWTLFRYVTHWATETHPNWRTCGFQVTLNSGSTLTHEFGFSAPDGTVHEEYAQVSPEEVRVASVTCREVEPS